MERLERDNYYHKVKEYAEEVISMQYQQKQQKQWKKTKTKMSNLMKLSIPEYFADQAANSRRKYWYVSGMGTINRALTKERLINSGFYDLATAYQSVHINY